MLDAFLLRSLAVAGWAPSFDDCARCGAPGPHRAFARGGGRHGLRPVPAAGLRRAGRGHPRAARALLTGDWEVADAADARDRREASGLVAAYLQWHLERGVRSLRMVERL